MAVITAEVLSACGVPPEEKESRAAAALEQKYGIQFEIKKVYPQKFGELYYEVQAYPVDDPELLFTANIDTEDDKSSDNYVERLVCRKVSGAVEKNLDGLPAYYYVYTIGIGAQSIVSDPSISIEAYSALDGGNKLRSLLFVVPDADTTADGLYESISKAFTGLEYLDASIRLMIASREEMDAIEAYFEQNDDLYSEYVGLTNHLTTVDIPFQNGSISISKDMFKAQIGGAV